MLVSSAPALLHIHLQDVSIMAPRVEHNERGRIITHDYISLLSYNSSGSPAQHTHTLRSEEHTSELQSR